EYIDVLRAVFRRDEPVSYHGEFVRMPYDGPNSWGMGKPLRVMVHPLRADLPIYLGAEGPKNVALAAEIADGWLPLYYSPFHPEVYADSLAGAGPDFEIIAGAQVNIDDDLEQALMPVKMMIGFYIGGMGAKGQNYHTKLMERFGFEAEAQKIQELFFDGKRDEAIAAVPDEFADAISLCGSPERIRDRVAAWDESAVTSLLVYSPGGPEALRQLAEILL
ncbi:MAG: LLM class flavin-dependent oxidoreductase, partial [Acidimicrobiales bacterium]